MPSGIPLESRHSLADVALRMRGTFMVSIVVCVLHDAHMIASLTQLRAIVVASLACPLPTRQALEGTTDTETVVLTSHRCCLLSTV